MFHNNCQPDLHLFGAFAPNRRFLTFKGAPPPTHKVQRALNVFFRRNVFFRLKLKIDRNFQRLPILGGMGTSHPSEMHFCMLASQILDNVPNETIVISNMTLLQNPNVFLRQHFPI